MDMNVTNGSNSTTTPGPSVVELITFAALSWTVIVSVIILIALVWCWDGSSSEEKMKYFQVVVTAIAVTAAVTAAVLLVVGSVLSTLNGDSTDTLGLSAEGITGRVLLILTVVISLVVWILGILFMAVWFYDAGGCNCSDGLDKFLVAMIVSGCVVTPVFVTGVVLLGWSSFEFDTIQGNGSNSTITPGLRTAGVVLSSFGLGVPFLVLVILVCIFFYFVCDDRDCISRAKKWLARVRRQQTKETEDARLREARSLLKEALKDGFVKSRTVVCLLVGVAGAGKTHTKHLLFRWAPPESRNSTPLATRPVQAIRVRASTQGGQLQEVDPKQLDKILAATVAAGVPLERRFIQRLQQLFCCKHNNQTTSIGMSAGIGPPSENIEHQTTSTGMSAGIGPPSENIEHQTTSTRMSPSDSHGSTASLSSQSITNQKKCCCCCPTAHSPATDSERTAKAALDKTTRQIANTSEPQQLLDCDWIYLIDSGGQIEFLEAMPAFLQHTSVCLFVTKLSEMLSECPKIEYFEDGKPVGEPTPCPFTNEQMLMRCVQTIQTQCIDHVGSTNKGSKQSQQDGSTNKGSKLVMVGTHRDLQGQCSESTEEKNDLLQRKLCPEFDKSLAFYRQGIIFPINAKNSGPQDHEVANAVTKVIFDVVSSLEPRKTPISWFKFEQLIQKIARDDEKRILHWKECLKVARLLHLSKKELNAALDHLTNFGVIHYYQHLLPNIVFVDPQILLNKISELVKHHYKLRHGSHSHTTLEVDWRKFTNEGCITLKLLRQFPEHYTDFFTAADFLKLMKDRLIATHLIGKDEYFMPCLLRTMEPPELDQYRAASSSESGVAPLAIHFSCQLVPHGVFCSLVAFLRSSQNSSPWSLFPHPHNTTEPQCLTRNCIKFQLPEDEPGSLTLIDAFSHFEVYVSTRRNICVHLCPSIWRTLFEGIHKAAKTLRYQLVPKQAFLCTKCKNTRPHLALPAAAFDYWKCKLHPDRSGPLKEEHKMWLPKRGVQAFTAEVRVVLEAPTEVDEDHPTVLECTRFHGLGRTINIPQEIGSNYYYFGLHLLDDPNGTRVRNLELEYRPNAERINTEIFREWATGRGKQPVSWETLTTVLRDIEFGALASEIEEVKSKRTMSTTIL